MRPVASSSVAPALRVTAKAPAPAAAKPVVAKSAIRTTTVGDARAFVAPDGVKVAFRVTEAKTKDPDAVIVHVPGLGCNSHYMDDMGAQLADENLKVYAIDNRGHGLTDGPKGDVGSYKLWVEDVDRLVKLAKQENPGKKIIVTGSSMGGLIALRYAQSHQKDIAGVASLSPVFLSKYFTPKQYGQLAWSVISRLWDKHALDRPMDTPMSMGIPLTTNPEAIEMGKNDPMLVDHVTARLYLNVLAMTMRNFAGALTQKLPTMVATAGADKVNVNFVVRAFQKLQGGFGLWDQGKTFKNYPGAGHDLPEEWQRPEIAQDIARFAKAQ